MPARTTARAALWLSLTAVALSGCRNPKTDTAVDCASPEANAGVDMSAEVDDVISLTAVESQVCSRLTPNYTWSFESLPLDSQVDDSTFTDNNSESAVETSFEPDVVGTYVVSVTVDDGIETSAADLVVIDIVSGNERPVADCGDNLTGEVGDLLQLDGSDSMDPEGAALEYAWSLATVPAESAMTSNDLYDSSTDAPTLVPDAAGVYITSLIVSDGDQWSEPDYCSLTIGSGNESPYADAGDSKVYPPCVDNTIQLNGNGSYDPEGIELEYLWSVVTVPAGSIANDGDFDDPANGSPSFTWDRAGEYTFQLMVSDGETWSAPDLVAAEITDKADNEAPEANAGDDQSLSLSADCVSSSYEWTCEDCSESSVELDGSGSEAEDGDDITFSWTETSGDLEIVAPSSAFTSVNTPSMTATYGTSDSVSYTVELTVSDCELSDTDEVTVQISCTGEN